MKQTRLLGDLVSVGPAILRDLEVLGVRSVAALARRNPEKLYEESLRCHRPVARHLLSRCVPRGGGAGPQPQAPCETMQLVVLEPAAQGPGKSPSQELDKRA